MKALVHPQVLAAGIHGQYIYHYLRRPEQGGELEAALLQVQVPGLAVKLEQRGDGGGAGAYLCHQLDDTCHHKASSAGVMERPMGDVGSQASHELGLRKALGEVAVLTQSPGHGLYQDVGQKSTTASGNRSVVQKERNIVFHGIFAELLVGHVVFPCALGDQLHQGVGCFGFDQIARQEKYLEGRENEGKRSIDYQCCDLKRKFRAGTLSLFLPS